ncbi:MAG: serine/threonine-protein kinase [Polyangiales bacterium]
MAKEGDTLDGRYLLRRMLGDGGMGNVFLAENVRLGNKPVAVKTLKPEYIANKDLVARFLEEALAASKVEHDNIVEVFDADIDAATGTPYIVQRYLKGTNLREHLDASPGRRLSPPEALDCVVPVMGALVATHKQKIIHRDIKPENIFLVRTSSGNTVPKLIDFGIAKHLEPLAHGRRTSTRAGSIWGTFDYMSPEQARGERAIDFRADIWSVGAVLFEALTGRLPYDVENHGALLQRFLEGPPPRADAAAPDVPADLADAVERALQIDPAKRYPTMAAFISTLIHCASYQSEVTWRAIPLSSPDLGDVPDLSSLARPATEDHGAAARRARSPRSAPPVAEEPTRRFRAPDGTREERLAPSTRTLELVVPDAFSARRALPYMIGLAAVLVGVVVGLRLRPAQEVAPRAALAQPALTRQDAALVAPAPPAPLTPAPVAPTQLVAPVPVAPVAPAVQVVAPAPPAAPRAVAARVARPRVVAPRVRTVAPRASGGGGGPVIQTEF